MFSLNFVEGEGGGGSVPFLVLGIWCREPPIPMASQWNYSYHFLGDNSLSVRHSMKQHTVWKLCFNHFLRIRSLAIEKIILNLYV